MDYGHTILLLSLIAVALGPLFVRDQRARRLMKRNKQLDEDFYKVSGHLVTRTKERDELQTRLNKANEKLRLWDAFISDMRRAYDERR